MSLLIDRVLKTKRPMPFPHLKGADGLSIALIFSHNPRALEQLQRKIDAEHKFTVGDALRFNEIMQEIYYDSKSHFGNNTVWLSLRTPETATELVDPEITKRFPKNPEAARALLEEMARSWAKSSSATVGNFEMTEEAVKKQVEMMRADPEKVMRFIGSRYLAGRYKDAAIALQHSRRLAISTARKYLAKAK